MSLSRSSLDASVAYLFGFCRRLSQCLNPRTFLMFNLYTPELRSVVILLISTVTSGTGGFMPFTHLLCLQSSGSYSTLGKTSYKVSSIRRTESAILLIPSDSCWIVPSLLKISVCKALRMWWLHSATIRKR